LTERLKLIYDLRAASRRSRRLRYFTNRKQSRTRISQEDLSFHAEVPSKKIFQNQLPSQKKQKAESDGKRPKMLALVAYETITRARESKRRKNFHR